jgi:hypothetical protein
MQTAKPRLLAIAAALVAASISLPALAQPGQVSPIDVTGKAPTTLRINVVGKDFATVRGEVHAAAATVCSNAVDNHELSFVDNAWCRDTAAYKAMRTYSRASKAPLFAQSGVIVLSAR